jgi:hypothetical protein
MVIKDNRILRRQKAKLIKIHREETWKMKLIQEELIAMRSQNEKYKLLLEGDNPAQNPLRVYVVNQMLLNKLDERIRKYPVKAKQLLKKELLDVEINEINSLENRIKFIVQAIEQTNDLYEDIDEWADQI